MLKNNLVSILLLISFVSILLVSCTSRDLPIGFESNLDSDSQTENTDILPSNIDVKPSNGRIEDFYSIDVTDSISNTAISYFVDNEACSDSLSSLFANSDEVLSIPILGPYLEKTSLCVCLFKKQGNLIGTKAIMVDSAGNVVSELEELLGDSYKETAFTDSYVFSVISDCLSSYPEFEIKGIVYDESGYMMVYPVGANANDETILFYNYKLLEFSLVDSFTSLREGREKFNTYWNFRANLISQIPIFKWENVSLHPNGYINKFRYQDIYYSGIDMNSCQYLFDYDWFVVVPLLSKTGHEGECVLHLLYQKDKLIAELVLQQDSEGIIRLIKERVSDKEIQTDQYVGLDGIDYVAQISYLSTNDSANIKGIGFDGEKYFIVHK